MSNRVAISTIEDMVEKDLVQAWSLLQDGQTDLALIELHNAIEHVKEIADLRAQESSTETQTTFQIIDVK